MVGSINDKKYLSDLTGNRRYWPVPIEKFDVSALRRDLDQLWAEAAHREAAGASIVLPEELWEEARVEQEKRVNTPDHILNLRDVVAEIKEGFIRNADVYQTAGLISSNPTPEERERIGGKYGASIKSEMALLGWEEDRPTIYSKLENEIVKKPVRGYRKGVGRPVYMAVADGRLVENKDATLDDPKADVFNHTAKTKANGFDHSAASRQRPKGSLPPEFDLPFD